MYNRDSIFRIPTISSTMLLYDCHYIIDCHYRYINSILPLRINTAIDAKICNFFFFFNKEKSIFSF